VTEEEGIYRVHAQAVIAAPILSVWQRLSDFEHFDRISPSIESSEVLSRSDDGSAVLRTSAEACVLVFCKRMRHVQTVRKPKFGLMEAEVDPKRSDFSLGRASWRLEPEGAATQVRFEGEMRPAFWIPPLIGGWLVERVLRQELERSLRNLERLARDDGE